MERGVSFARLEMTGPERFVPLRRMLGISAFGMNLILLQPGQRGRIHRHQTQEEVYLVLGGAGEHVARDGVAFVSRNATEGAAPQEIPLPEDLPASERRR